jgi:DNA-directed RNA polymerase specialized sigma24 family protein
MTFRVRFETAVQLIAEKLRCGPPEVYYVPGSDYARRVVQRARELCRQGSPGTQAALQSLRENQTPEVARVVKAIESSAPWVARRFDLDVEDVVSQAVAGGMATITRKFRPPFHEGAKAIEGCLRAYVSKRVYRAGLELKYPRRRRVFYSLTEEVLDQVDCQLDLISEIPLHEKLVAVYEKLRAWLQKKPERLRRLKAIMRCKTLHEAAKECGISAEALRQWLYKLRKLVRRWLADE